MHGINIVKNIVTKNYIHLVTQQVDLSCIIDGNNIFWTLFLILGLFMILEQAKKNKIWAVGAAVVVPLIAMSEGGLYLLPIAFACFYFNNDPKKVSAVIFGWSMILLVKAVYTYFTSMVGLTSLYGHLAFSNEFMMLAAIPFMLSYKGNGKKGGTGKPWEKNLFYIFYPLHLTIIYIIMWIFQIQ